uniref:Uncharacterized protein n=1 Tax=Oryza brachyantha TaxID=4533 RepID=J3LVC0_ORYBR
MLEATGQRGTVVFSLRSLTTPTTQGHHQISSRFNRLAHCFWHWTTDETPASVCARREEVACAGRGRMRRRWGVAPAPVEESSSVGGGRRDSMGDD